MIRARRPYVKAACSMFSQILKLVPRVEFEELVRQTQAERAAKD